MKVTERAKTWKSKDKKFNYRTVPKSFKDLFFYSFNYFMCMRVLPESRSTHHMLALPQGARIA